VVSMASTNVCKPHTWLLESPHGGGKVSGYCTKCGEMRSDFRTSTTTGGWDRGITSMEVKQRRAKERYRLRTEKARIDKEKRQK